MGKKKPQLNLQGNNHNLSMRHLMLFAHTVRYIISVNANEETAIKSILGEGIYETTSFTIFNFQVRFYLTTKEHSMGARSGN